MPESPDLLVDPRAVGRTGSGRAPGERRSDGANAAGVAALRSRLESGVPIILGERYETASLETMELLLRLSQAVIGTEDRSRFWLLMTCVAGAFPTRDEFVRGYRMLELAEPGTEHLEMLRACTSAASTNDNFRRPIAVLRDRVIVDVDFCARHGHNTGVQRVVRETTRRWNAAHDITLVAWSNDGGIMRTLVPEETVRVLDWNSSRRLEHSPDDWENSAELIVPWDCTIVLPEVAQSRVWERMSCLTEFSSNRVALVGYDAIPVTSAEWVVPSEADRFVRYLSIVKHADLVAGISASSAEEFAGFSDALVAQGLVGPRVTSVKLPVALAEKEQREHGHSERSDPLPLVVCVGTQEPRKNQLAVLAASETLWREGFEFEVLFIGSAAVPLSFPFDAELDRLRRLGRKVSVLRGASDAILEQAYLDARFSIFVSMHEGYGLPIGESLAAGTPVIATDYGSMAEIARSGGCIMVDPRDDDAIAAAMRRLLEDDAELARLAAEAEARPPRTWDDYATELWNVVTERTVATSREAS